MTGEAYMPPSNTFAWLAFIRSHPPHPRNLLEGEGGYGGNATAATEWLQGM